MPLSACAYDLQPPPASRQVELSSFEDLGRLLADVRAFARRGRKVRDSPPLQHRTLRAVNTRSAVSSGRHPGLEVHG